MVLSFRRHVAEAFTVILVLRLRTDTCVFYEIIALLSDDDIGIYIDLILRMKWLICAKVGADLISISKVNKLKTKLPAFLANLYNKLLTMIGRRSKMNHGTL